MSLSMDPECNMNEVKEETVTPSTSATLVGEQDAETGQRQIRKREPSLRNRCFQQY